MSRLISRDGECGSGSRPFPGVQGAAEDAELNVNVGDIHEFTGA